MRSYLAPDIVVQIFSADVEYAKKHQVMKMLRIAEMDERMEIVTSDFAVLETMYALQGKKLDHTGMLLFYEVVTVIPTSVKIRKEYILAPKSERAAKLLKLAGLDK